MKCKQNDLCFVIKSRVNNNLGKIVTCKEYLGFLEKGRHTWRGIEFDIFYTDHHWIAEGNIETISGHKLGYASFSENQLLPIPTEPIEDSEISSKELEIN